MKRGRDRDLVSSLAVCVWSIDRYIGKRAPAVFALHTHDTQHAALSQQIHSSVLSQISRKKIAHAHQIGRAT